MTRITQISEEVIVKLGDTYRHPNVNEWCSRSIFQLSEPTALGINVCNTDVGDVVGHAFPGYLEAVSQLGITRPGQFLATLERNFKILPWTALQDEVIVR